jgi:hypothetical protein
MTLAIQNLVADQKDHQFQILQKVEDSLLDFTNLK